MPDTITLPDWPRGMRIEIAAQYVGISASLLQAQVARGEFPKPIQVSAGRVVWLKEDVDRWLDAKAGRGNGAGRTSDMDPVREWDLALGGDRAA